MGEKHFILATAGHVDHGKSALVRALTGTDPDRLPEEKARGMTIELGFAQLALPSPDGKIHVGIVDVPGHEDFMKNMLAGISSIDLAVLVVAVDDGWMPQTEEHLQILTYLGIKRAVIALTKLDLAKSENAIEAEVRAKLSGTPFADSKIVHTSVAAAYGIEQLKAQLAYEFGSLVPQRDIDKPRLAVDRAFSLRGIGTVVTGTLLGGTFERGGAVVIQPLNLPARIRAIQSHNRELEEIGPGRRTALNIADVPINRGKNLCGVWRGDVITRPEFGTASAVADVALTRSWRLAAKTRPLKQGTTVSVHHGTGNFGARIFFEKQEELCPGGCLIAEVRFDVPVFMFAGDRFVLRDSSQQSTLAGGVVLDPDASVKNFHGDAQQKFLSERARYPEDAVVFVSTQLTRDRAGKRSAMLIKSRFGHSEISAAISELIRTGIVIGRGDLVIDAKWWAFFCERAMSAIDAEHTMHPNRLGMELSHLRNALGREMPLAEVFEAVVSELSKHGFVRAGATIQRATHRPALSPQLRAASAQICAALAAKPFDPPSRKELAPDSISQQALRFLRDTDEVTEISSDVILSREALLKARHAVLEFIEASGPATISDLRNLLGSSRRVVVPLLEYFDREGLTRRLGDKRMLGQHKGSCDMTQ